MLKPGGVQSLRTNKGALPRLSATDSPGFYDQKEETSRLHLFPNTPAGGARRPKAGASISLIRACGLCVVWDRRLKKPLH